MPYLNYHAARIKSPSAFKSIKVLQTLSNSIMLYGGKLKSKLDGSSVVQSVRFPKGKFSVLSAKKWLRSHDYKYLQFEPATAMKKGTCIWDGLFDLLMKDIRDEQR